ncbi:hypothetical protein WDU94_002387 [Cyamophila willieti]
MLLCSQEVSTERGGGGVDTSDVSSDEEADEDSTGGEDIDNGETWTSPSHPGGPSTGENWDKTGRYIPLKWGSSGGGTSVNTGGPPISSADKRQGPPISADNRRSADIRRVRRSRDKPKSVTSTSSFLDKLYHYEWDLPPPAGTPAPPSPSTVKPGGGSGSHPCTPLLPYDTLGTHTEGEPYQGGDVSYDSSTKNPPTPHDNEPVDPSDVSSPHNSDPITVDSSNVTLPLNPLTSGSTDDYVKSPQDATTVTDSDDLPPPPPPHLDDVPPSPSHHPHPQSLPLPIPASPPPPPPSSSSSSPSS